MRSGILTFGAFLLIVSALFFYIPWTTATAQAINTGEATEEALSAPRYWALAGMVIGSLLAVIGLLMPDPKPMRMAPPQSYATSGPVARRNSR
jgi:hypothetical protein